MSRKDSLYMNINILVCCVILGIGVGFLAGAVTQWLFIIGLAPIALAGFAAWTLYRLGHIHGQMDEMDRYDKGWGALHSFIEEIEAERNKNESGDPR